ncbi:uncharacterized protein BP5553_05316 [Venustampulla echinocandica]|uniref:Pentacotripeptide-repeat region of PRORP domain-containing protein n=1 Tax=Venustampulla echinocandica TaxID=2656787 RepID=A0A370TQT2_9HELO|nr:uncharacterized protein BP5553_05316 [Venustampulla echinocandica]RDL37883.1 hypothetical protein BP5553_05316 [Venustampulla echinocandica]
MLIRAELLPRRWPTIELPVLQFLAPRVFQLWPYQHGSRRNYSASQPVQRDEGIDGSLSESAFGHENENWQQGWKQESWRQKSVEPPAGGRRGVRRSGLVRHVHAKRGILPRKKGGLNEAERYFSHLEIFRQSPRRPQKTYQRYGLRTHAPKVSSLQNPYPCKDDPSPMPISFLRSCYRVYSKYPPSKGRDMRWDLVTELISMSTSTSIRERWREAIPHSGPWMAVIAIAMRDYPHKALKVLSGTYTDPYPPAPVVADSLDFIIWYYLDGTKPTSDGPSVYLYKTITKLLRHGPPDYVYLSHPSILLLLSRVPTADHVVELYRSLEEINNPFTADTLAHFASRLADSGPAYQNIAFEILRRIGDLKEPFNSGKMRSICTTMLLNSSRDGKVSHSEMFEYMMKCGLVPNGIIYNVVLSKMLEAGDSVGGWRLYQRMKNHGPRPSNRTYSILLNDAKCRMDTNDIQRVLTVVKKSQIRNRFIVADALHSILHFDKQESLRALYEAEPEPYETNRRRPTSLEKMLPIYCEYFSFTPLANLLPGLAQRFPEFVEPQDCPRLIPIRPPPVIIVIMVTAFLKDCVDPKSPKAFYTHWCKLARDGDPLLIALSKVRDGFYFVHVFNLVLMALGRHAINLPTCLKIIGEMSSSGIGPAAGAEPAGVNKPEPVLRLPKPGVGTWSVLAQIFMAQRQPRAAEKVLAMMRERGIPPNDVTWNILIAGYVRMQNMPMIIDAVDRKERAGCPHDRITFSILRRVEDRRSLFEGLQKKQMETLQSYLLEQETSEGEGKSDDKLEEDVDREHVDDEELVVEDMPSASWYRTSLAPLGESKNQV